MSTTPEQTPNTIRMPTTTNEALASSSSLSTTNGTITAPQGKSRLYFAYGSNLSTTQMAYRCPGARPLHLGWVSGWKFIINARGVANIVPDPVLDPSTGKNNPGVFGVVYEIDDEDEDSLDLCEGVPDVYEKVEMMVWMRRQGGGVEGLNREQGGGGVTESGSMALVYVDTKRTVEGKPRPEYVHRMNRGIEEASRPGQNGRLPLPGWYVDEVMRRYIPA
jgi:gamma-glutamylcyclotransferase